MLHHTLQVSNKMIIISGYLSIILCFLTITIKYAKLSMLIQTDIVSMYKSFFIIMGTVTINTSYALIGVILFSNLMSSCYPSIVALEPGLYKILPDNGECETTVQGTDVFLKGALSGMKCSSAGW